LTVGDATADRSLTAGAGEVVMTDERKPPDEEPVEAWDDEGGAAEREAEVPGEARAKRWFDERGEHWHGATSSDATQAREQDG
jgi:hypothetical protein